MIIGLPKEIKNSEFRVGMTNENVQKLTNLGHQVFVQKTAGEEVGISDSDYEKAGAELLDQLEDVYKKSEMIVKVKEPLKKEYALFQERQILFTFLHLAPEPELTSALCSKKVSGLAYETIENQQGQLPLLKPMSEVAGRVGLQNGVYYLQKFTGGKGILPGGIEGAKKAQVTILGGGTAGLHSALSAVGLSAQVSILDINEDRLKKLSRFFNNKVECLPSNEKNILRLLETTDILIGSVLVTGHKAPKLITKEMMPALPEKSVAVDISIDQGGCIETARPTSHTNPVYTVDGIIHYCVPNIPSAVARTSTFALTNQSYPYIEKIAEQGLTKALKNDTGLKKGLNTYKGSITYEPVAMALNQDYTALEKLGF